MSVEELLSELNTPSGKMLLRQFAKIAKEEYEKAPKKRKWLKTREAMKELGTEDYRVLPRLFKQGKIKKRGTGKTAQWDLTSYE